MKWVKRWNDVIAAEPELDGVWRRRDGGFRIRGRIKDPKSAKLREVNRALPKCVRAREAAAELQAELDRIRAGTADSRAFPTFTDYALELFERKIQTGVIASAAGREKWAHILELHLLPYFGSWFLDKITKRDIEMWKVEMAERPRRGRDPKKPLGGNYSPTTINTALSVLKAIMSAASDDFEDLPDVAAKVAPLPLRTHRTYTVEAPNRLPVELVEPFLGEMRARWPEHYAISYLGFMTGLRPSSLRPLRRRGPQPDVNWTTGELLVRRSHTIGDETMLGTKNGDDQRLKLPREVLKVLQWHAQRLDRENEKRRRRHPELAAAMDASDLLFPAEPNGRNKGGGYRTKSSLKKAFAEVGTAIGLTYEVTPRSMRRTFQDIARAAGVADVVTRAISGHRTPEMQQRYSTVDVDEASAAMASIVSLAVRRRRSPPGSPPPPPNEANQRQPAETQPEETTERLSA